MGLIFSQNLEDLQYLSTIDFIILVMERKTLTIYFNIYSSQNVKFFRKCSSIEGKFGRLISTFEMG